MNLAEDSDSNDIDKETKSERNVHGTNRNPENFESQRKRVSSSADSNSFTPETWKLKHGFALIIISASFLVLLYNIRVRILNSTLPAQKISNGYFDTFSIYYGVSIVSIFFFVGFWFDLLIHIINGMFSMVMKYGLKEKHGKILFTKEVHFDELVFDHKKSLLSNSISAELRKKSQIILLTWPPLQRTNKIINFNKIYISKSRNVPKRVTDIDSKESISGDYEPHIEVQKSNGNPIVSGETTRNEKDTQSFMPKIEILVFVLCTLFNFVLSPFFYLLKSFMTQLFWKFVHSHFFTGVFFEGVEYFLSIENIFVEIKIHGVLLEVSGLILPPSSLSTGSGLRRSPIKLSPIVSSGTLTTIISEFTINTYDVKWNDRRTSRRHPMGPTFLNNNNNKIISIQSEKCSPLPLFSLRGLRHTIFTEFLRKPYPVLDCGSLSVSMLILDVRIEWIMYLLDLFSFLYSTKNESMGEMSSKKKRVDSYKCGINGTPLLLKSLFSLETFEVRIHTVFIDHCVSFSPLKISIEPSNMGNIYIQKIRSNVSGNVSHDNNNMFCYWNTIKINTSCKIDAITHESSFLSMFDEELNGFILPKDREILSDSKCEDSSYRKEYQVDDMTHGKEHGSLFKERVTFLTIRTVTISFGISPSSHLNINCTIDGTDLLFISPGFIFLVRSLVLCGTVFKCNRYPLRKNRKNFLTADLYYRRLWGSPHIPNSSYNPLLTSARQSMINVEIDLSNTVVRLEGGLEEKEPLLRDYHLEIGKGIVFVDMFDNEVFFYGKDCVLKSVPSSRANKQDGYALKESLGCDDDKTVLLKLEQMRGLVPLNHYPLPQHSPVAENIFPDDRTDDRTYKGDDCTDIEEKRKKTQAWIRYEEARPPFKITSSKSSLIGIPPVLIDFINPSLNYSKDIFDLASKLTIISMRDHMVSSLLLPLCFDDHLKHECRTNKEFLTKGLCLKTSSAYKILPLYQPVSISISNLTLNLSHRRNPFQGGDKENVETADSVNYIDSSFNLVSSDFSIFVGPTPHEMQLSVGDIRLIFEESTIISLTSFILNISTRGYPKEQNEAEITSSPEMVSLFEDVISASEYTAHPRAFSRIQLILDGVSNVVLPSTRLIHLTLLVKRVFRNMNVLFLNRMRAVEWWRPSHRGKVQYISFSTTGEFSFAFRECHCNSTSHFSSVLLDQKSPIRRKVCNRGGIACYNSPNIMKLDLGSIFFQVNKMSSSSSFSCGGSDNSNNNSKDLDAVNFTVKYMHLFLSDDISLFFGNISSRLSRGKWIISVDLIDESNIDPKWFGTHPITNSFNGGVIPVSVVLYCRSNILRIINRIMYFQSLISNITDDLISTPTDISYSTSQKKSVDKRESNEYQSKSILAYPLVINFSFLKRFYFLWEVDGIPPLTISTCSLTFSSEIKEIEESIEITNNTLNNINGIRDTEENGTLLVDDSCWATRLPPNVSIHFLIKAGCSVSRQETDTIFDIGGFKNEVTIIIRNGDEGSKYEQKMDSNSNSIKCYENNRRSTSPPINNSTADKRIDLSISGALYQALSGNCNKCLRNSAREQGTKDLNVSIAFYRIKKILSLVGSNENRTLPSHLDANSENGYNDKLGFLENPIKFSTPYDNISPEYNQRRIKVDKQQIDRTRHTKDIIGKSIFTKLISRLNQWTVNISISLEHAPMDLRIGFWILFIGKGTFIASHRFAFRDIMKLLDSSQIESMGPLFNPLQPIGKDTQFVAKLNGIIIGVRAANVNRSNKIDINQLQIFNKKINEDLFCEVLRCGKAKIKLSVDTRVRNVSRIMLDPTNRSNVESDITCLHSNNSRTCDLTNPSDSQIKIPKSVKEKEKDSKRVVFVIYLPAADLSFSGIQQKAFSSSLHVFSVIAKYISQWRRKFLDDIISIRAVNASRDKHAHNHVLNVDNIIHGNYTYTETFLPDSRLHPSSGGGKSTFHTLNSVLDFRLDLVFKGHGIQLNVSTCSRSSPFRERDVESCKPKITGMRDCVKPTTQKTSYPDITSSSNIEFNKFQESILDSVSSRINDAEKTIPSYSTGRAIGSMVDQLPPLGAKLGFQRDATIPQQGVAHISKDMSLSDDNKLHAEVDLDITLLRLSECYPTGIDEERSIALHRRTLSSYVTDLSLQSDYPRIHRRFPDDVLGNLNSPETTRLSSPGSLTNEGVCETSHRDIKNGVSVNINVSNDICGPKKDSSSKNDGVLLDKKHGHVTSLDHLTASGFSDPTRSTNSDMILNPATRIAGDCIPCTRHEAVLNCSPWSNILQRYAQRNSTTSSNSVMLSLPPSLTNDIRYPEGSQLLLVANLVVIEVSFVLINGQLDHSLSLEVSGINGSEGPTNLRGLLWSRNVISETDTRSSQKAGSCDQISEPIENMKRDQNLRSDPTSNTRDKSGAMGILREVLNLPSAKLTFSLRILPLGDSDLTAYIPRIFIGADSESFHRVMDVIVNIILAREKYSDSQKRMTEELIAEFLDNGKSTVTHSDISLLKDPSSLEEFKEHELPQTHQLKKLSKSSITKSIIKLIDSETSVTPSSSIRPKQKSRNILFELLIDSLQLNIIVDGNVLMRVNIERVDGSLLQLSRLPFTDLTFAEPDMLTTPNIDGTPSHRKSIPRSLDSEQSAVTFSLSIRRMVITSPMDKSRDTNHPSSRFRHLLKRHRAVPNLSNSNATFRREEVHTKETSDEEERDVTTGDVNLIDHGGTILLQPLIENLQGSLPILRHSGHTHRDVHQNDVLTSRDISMDTVTLMQTVLPTTPTGTRDVDMIAFRGSDRYIRLEDSDDQSEEAGFLSTKSSMSSTYRIFDELWVSISPIYFDFTKELFDGLYKYIFPPNKDKSSNSLFSLIMHGKKKKKEKENDSGKNDSLIFFKYVRFSEINARISFRTQMKGISINDLSIVINSVSKRRELCTVKGLLDNWLQCIIQNVLRCVVKHPFLKISKGTKGPPFRRREKEVPNEIVSLENIPVTGSIPSTISLEARIDDSEIGYTGNDSDDGIVTKDVFPFHTKARQCTPDSQEYISAMEMCFGALFYQHGFS